MNIKIQLNDYYLNQLIDSLQHLSKGLSFDLSLIIKRDGYNLEIEEIIFDALVDELYVITEDVDNKFLDLLSSLINKDKRKEQ